MFLWYTYARVVLVMPALLALYVAVLFSLVRLGEVQSISVDDNRWLAAAERIALVPYPDLYSAIAHYDRARSSLKSDPYLKKIWLQSAYDNWVLATKSRPDWTYYRVFAFDALVNLSFYKGGVDISKAFDSLIESISNERGVDKALFEAALWVWRDLREDQRGWLVDRIASSGDVRYALNRAGDLGFKSHVCARLPWDISSKYCKSSGKYRTGSKEKNALLKRLF